MTEQLNVRTEVVTPAKAKKWLTLNTHNRAVKPRHVKALAKQMADNKWKLNGDAIRMNGSRLIDGQHRLLACVEANVSFKTLVIRDLDTDVFDTIDAGRKRTTGDSLTVAGEKNANLLAAAGTFLIAYRRGNVSRRDGISNGQIFELLESDPKLRDSVAFTVRHIKNIRNFISQAVFAALHYLCSEVDDVLADDFFSRLAKGHGIEQDSPMAVLRERLIQNSCSREKISKDVMAALIIKTWNAEWTGKSLKKLRYSQNEQFPQIAS